MMAQASWMLVLQVLLSGILSGICCGKYIICGKLSSDSRLPLKRAGQLVAFLVFVG